MLTCVYDQDFREKFGETNIIFGWKRFIMSYTLEYNIPSFGIRVRCDSRGTGPNC